MSTLRKRKTKQMGDFQENAGALVQCLQSNCQSSSNYVRKLQCIERCTRDFCRRHGLPVDAQKWNRKKLADTLAKLKKMAAVVNTKARNSQLRNPQNAQLYINNLNSLFSCINRSTSQEGLVSCFSAFCRAEQTRFRQFGSIQLKSIQSKSKKSKTMVQEFF